MLYNSCDNVFWWRCDTFSTMAAKQETTNQQILQMLGQFGALRQTKSGYFGSDIQRPKYHLFLPDQGSLVIKMYITIAGLRQFTAPTFHFQGWRKSSDYPLTNSSNVKTLKEKLVFQILLLTHYCFDFFIYSW